MPEKLFIDPRQDHAARMALADLLRAARPAAREGDFFCPDVAEVFRVRIAHALIANRVKASDLLRAGEDEELPDVPPAVVNQALSWQSSNVMWPSMLHALPPLPEELNPLRGRRLDPDRRARQPGRRHPAQRAAGGLKEVSGLRSQGWARPEVLRPESRTGALSLGARCEISLRRPGVASAPGWANRRS